MTTRLGFKVKEKCCGFRDFLVVLFFISGNLIGAEQDTQLAPPMGWNSWNHFGRLVFGDGCNSRLPRARRGSEAG